MDQEIRERFTNMLTEKVVDAIRQMPAVTNEDVRDMEVVVAAQLLTGERSMEPGYARGVVLIGQED